MALMRSVHAAAIAWSPFFVHVQPPRQAELWRQVAAESQTSRQADRGVLAEVSLLSWANLLWLGLAQLRRLTSASAPRSACLDVCDSGASCGACCADMLVTHLQLLHVAATGQSRSSQSDQQEENEELEDMDDDEEEASAAIGSAPLVALPKQLLNGHMSHLTSATLQACEHFSRPRGANHSQGCTLQRRRGATPPLAAAARAALAGLGGPRGSVAAQRACLAALVSRGDPHPQKDAGLSDAAAVCPAKET